MVIITVQITTIVVTELAGGEYMNISTRKIAHLMGVKLMNQGQLAQASGVSRATINNTLLKGSCSTQTAGKIAKALGVDPVEIIEKED